MTRQPRTGYEELTPSQAARIDDICDLFEQAWQDDKQPTIDLFLANFQEPEAGVLARELILLDLAYRRRAGLPANTERYASLVPAIDPDWLWIVAPPNTLAALNSTASSPHLDDRIPTIPGYSLHSELGRGGMGVVYLAQQEELQRLVAVKVLRFDGLSGGVLQHRFRQEALSVARLRHPHIIRIHDVGVLDHLSYLVLEYAEGGSLQSRLRGQPLSSHDAARLLVPIARAIHHAHQHDILHRDMKPANILLVATDRIPEWSQVSVVPSAPSPLDLPLAALSPMITDFGLAKEMTNDGEQTKSGTIVGTPCYMAPEQAAGQSRSLGPACDIWALGAILFELLTGRPPFQADSPVMTMWQVQYLEPVPVRRLQPGVPRDLETICCKCLEKDPTRRYSSAELLAEDLERFLAGKPVLARPISALAHARRWCRRNPALASLWAALLVSLVVGLASVTWKWNEALSLASEKERLLGEERLLIEQNEHALHEARVNLDFHRITLAHRDLLANHPAEAQTLLDACLPVSRTYWEWRYLDQVCNSHLSTYSVGPSFMGLVSYDIEGRHLVLANHYLTRVSVREPSTGAVMRSLPGTGFWNVQLQLTPLHDGLVEPKGPAAARAGPLTIHQGRAIVWNVATGQPLVTLPAPPGNPQVLACSRTGRYLASFLGEGALEIWDTKIGKTVSKIEGFRPRKVVGGNVWPITYANAVAMSPDGESIATIDRTVVTVWNANTGQVKKALQDHSYYVHHLSFSPDGRRLAMVTDRAINLFDAKSLQLLRAIPTPGNPTRGMAFSSDGQRLGTYHADRSVRWWELQTGLILTSILAGSRPLTGLCLHPKAPLAFSADQGGTGRVWNLSVGQQAHCLLQRPHTLDAVAFSPEGKRLYVGGADDRVEHRIRILSVPDYAPLGPALEQPDPRLILAISSDGKYLAVASGMVVSVYDGRTSKLLRRFTSHKEYLFSLNFQPGTNLLASASGDGIAHIWDPATGKLVAKFTTLLKNTHMVHFSPDGRILATAGRDPTVILHDAQTGQEIRRLKGHRERVVSLAFTGDGQHLATGSMDATIRLWDVSSGASRYQFTSHNQMVSSLAFTKDGTRLASGSPDGTVKFWDPITGRETLTLRGHRAGRIRLAFRPDDQQLATVGGDGRLLIWSAPRKPGDANP